MAELQTSLYGYRAEQLAIVYLTRRKDISITEFPGRQGPDLLVSILHEGRDFGRLLAIEVKGLSSHKVRHVQEGIEIRSLRIEDTIYQDLSFPVCLFAFTMEDDHGYWKWIKEPVADSRYPRSLQFNHSSIFKPLTNADLNALITTVDRWYEQQDR